MASFITFKKVYKRYGEGTAEVCALNGMDFEIGQGELVVIVGPSGSGKTTLLNVLGGMDTCDDGVVMVDGQQVQHYSRKELIQYRRHEVGFVFQFYNLIQNLTALSRVTISSNFRCIKSFCRSPALAIPLLYLRISDGLMSRLLANSDTLMNGKARIRPAPHAACRCTKNCADTSTLISCRSKCQPSRR